MKEVLLPELAESVVEGEILKWLVQEGDTIALEQPLCEVMTDKVTVELPSPVAGVLSKRLAGEGDVVAVHAAIALIDETGGAAAAPAPAATAPAPAAAPLSTQAQEEREQVGGSIVEAGHLQKGADDDSTSLFKAFSSDEKVQVQGLGARQPAAPATPAQPTRADGRVLAVPAARQLARELNLDLTQVRGSGPNGRIRVSDVLAHQGINQGQAAPTQTAAPAPATAQAAQPAAAPAKAPAAGGMPVAPVQYRTPKGYEHLEDRVPLRGMRRAISNQMQASHLYTVRTLTVDEVNLSRLVEFRARVKEDAAAAGVKLS